MGWRHVLVNHTLKVIEETGLRTVTTLMNFLIKEHGWSMTHHIEMLYEEESWNEIEKYVNMGYKRLYRFI